MKSERQSEAITIIGLHQKPYEVVDFPLSKDQIDRAMNSFFAFLDLSDEIKTHIDLKISPLHRRGDIGFKHRKAEDDIYNDNKDFFHYHPIIDKEYTAFIQQHPVVKQFLNCAFPIWEAVYQTTKEILSGFDTQHPGTSAKIFETDTPHIILRFLKYDYQKSGAYLAKPHFDSGSFTLAIAESSPGLRIGTNPRDLDLVHHREAQAIFMVSSNYGKIVDEPLMPAWHDVIQLDTSKLNQPFSRWAMVAFIDGHSVESLPRSETHKYFKSTPEL